MLPEQWPGGVVDDDAQTSLARGLAMLASASPPDQFAVNARFEAQIRARLQPFEVGGRCVVWLQRWGRSQRRRSRQTHLHVLHQWLK